MLVRPGNPRPSFTEACLGAALGVAAVTASMALGCGRRGREAAPATAARPSIVLISLDTTRADHLGCYGGGKTTPNIDAWAREGVIFDLALTPVPITLPAHASLLTGLLPHRHGVRDNGVYRLPEDVATLAATLGGAGYDTAAVVGSAVLDRQYGLARGFARYDDRVEGAGAGQLAIAERPATAVTDAAIRTARELRTPFFLFVHYFDAHAVYQPPSPFRERFAESLYAGEIAYVDDQIGRLRRELAGLGRAEDLVAVVTADHGESLGEHGEATHGVFLYQSTLHVPLVVIAPGRWPAGSRAAAPVSLVDIAPTLAQFAGAAIPGTLDGRALDPKAAAGGDRWLPLESEFGYNSYGWAPLVGLTDGRLKWVGAPGPELYDLHADPHEATNLAAPRARDLQGLEALWRTLVTQDRRALREAAGGASAEEAERKARLAALGYVAGSAGPDPHARGLPDPKAVIGTLELVNRARGLIGERRFDEAERVLDQARKAAPRNLSALTLLGVARLLSGRPAPAVEPLREAARIGPANADVHFNLGLALLGAGQVEPALEAWRRTLALAPRYHDAAVNLIDILARTGRPREAQEALRAARRAGLESPTLDFLDGKLAAARGDRPAARAALERALGGALTPPAAAEAREILSALGR